MKKLVRLQGQVNDAQKTYDAVNKEFVEQMEDLTAQCRWELRKKEQQNIHQTEPDDGHDTDFDEEAGRKEL